MAKNNKADFDKKVADLARRGHSQRDIAKQLNTNRPKVRRALARAKAHAEAADLVAPPSAQPVVDDTPPPEPEEQVQLLGNLFRSSAETASRLRRTGDLAGAASHSRLCSALSAAMARIGRQAKPAEQEWPPPVVNQERVKEIQGAARSKLFGYVAAVMRRQDAGMPLRMTGENFKAWLAEQDDPEAAAEELFTTCTDAEIIYLSRDMERLEAVELVKRLLSVQDSTELREAAAATAELAERYANEPAVRRERDALLAALAEPQQPPPPLPPELEGRARALLELSAPHDSDPTIAELRAQLFDLLEQPAPEASP